MSLQKKEILTVEEAALILKVNIELVTTLLEEKEIPGRQIGGEWRTTQRALLSYVDGAPLQGSGGSCVPMQCCTPEGDATGVFQCCVPGDSGCC